MDTLPAETLAKIFSHCELDDRLVFESINNRIRSCIRPYVYFDTTILDVAYLETVTRRPLFLFRTPNQRGNTDDADDEDMVIFSNIKKTTTNSEDAYTRFILSLLDVVFPRFGDRLEGVRFGGGEHRPIIEKEILFALHDKCAAGLTNLDFGRRRVRLDALRVLPHFTNLRRLRILNAGDRFTEILGEFRGGRLVDLEFGGLHRSIGEAIDTSALRRLVLHSGVWSPWMITTGVGFPQAPALPVEFPNAQVFHIKPADRFRRQYCGNIMMGRCYGYGYSKMDKRVEFFRRRFPRLRRSNVFGCRHVNIASLLAHQVPAARNIQNLRIELPNWSDSYGMNSTDPVVRGERDRALMQIRSWPAFFDRFSNIKRLHISNWNNAFEFRVADLFNLPTLLMSSNLRALTLDGLTFKLEDIEGSREILAQFDDTNRSCGGRISAAKKQTEAGRMFDRLQKLTVKRSTVGFPSPDYDYNGKQKVALIMRSVGVLDVFIRFVLSGSCGDGLRKLDLECPDGSRVWSSVIQYAERFAAASACPLETLRISWFPNLWSDETLPIPLPLPDLASVTWPRLRELRVDYSNFDAPATKVTTNLRAVRSGINTSSPAGRFGGRALARAFPRLRVFSWPYMRDSEIVYQAVMKCEYLRRIIIFVDREPIDLSRYVTISHRRLERIDLVRLSCDSPKISDLKTDKLVMFEKRRVIRDVDGLKESQLMVVERNGYK